MLLKSIHIKGFWSKYSLDWDLQADVNILSGINGSGKTTLFNIVYAIFNPSLLPFVKDKFLSAEITCTDEYRVVCERKKNEEFVTTYYWQGQEIPLEKMPISIGAMSTFDINMPNEEQYKQYLAFKKDRIRSELDLRLDEWINAYYKYLAVISKEVENAVKQKPNNVEELLGLYDRKSHFIAKTNEMFAPTRKKWDETTNEVRFLLDDGQPILPRELSSGEKQLLCLLLFTLIQNDKESIVFWDEPEISMHIDWQRMLIRIAREINPNGQLLIATHSPSIIYEGWEMRVSNMEDMLK